MSAKTAISTGAKTVLAGAVGGATDGAVSGGGTYLVQPGPHTVNGFLTSTATGAGTGAVLGGAGGAAAHGVSTASNRLLSTTEECVTGCFVAGTAVLMADGSSRAIEEVEPGEEVVAFDPGTGETQTRRVVDAFTHTDVPTYDVVLGEEGEDEEHRVTTTAEHPFMVVGQGWTPVRELRKGDELVRPTVRPSRSVRSTPPAGPRRCTTSRSRVCTATTCRSASNGSWYTTATAEYLGSSPASRGSSTPSRPR